MMAAFGDRPIGRVTTREVSDFLRRLDREGLTARNVNKHRQTAGDDVPLRVPGRHPQPAGQPGGPDGQASGAAACGACLLRVEEAEALARAATAGEHRAGPRDEWMRREHAQDAELCRVLFYTGLRLGEAIVLRWADVDLEARTILVRRGVVGRCRDAAQGPALPLRAARAAGQPYARAPLEPARVPRARLLRVLHCARDADGRIGAAATLQARVRGGRSASRHPAPTAARSGEHRRPHHRSVSVREMLGHAKLTTTDRNLGTKLRPEALACLGAAVVRESARRLAEVGVAAD